VTEPGAFGRSGVGISEANGLITENDAELLLDKDWADEWATLPEAPHLIPAKDYSNTNPLPFIVFSVLVLLFALGVIALFTVIV
jgi:hypothetical protein